jgi:hypothetical protein
LEYTLEPLNRFSTTYPSAEQATRRPIFKAEEKIDPTTGRLPVWQLADMSWWSDTTRDKPVLVDIQRARPGRHARLRRGPGQRGLGPSHGALPRAQGQGEVLEIVIQNTGSQFEGASGIVETHPFHAHGQHYYDLGSGAGPVRRRGAPCAAGEPGRVHGHQARHDDAVPLRRGQGRARRARRVGAYGGGEDC